MIINRMAELTISEFFIKKYPDIFQDLVPGSKIEVRILNVCHEGDFGEDGSVDTGYTCVMPGGVLLTIWDPEKLRILESEEGCYVAQLARQDQANQTHDKPT